MNWGYYFAAVILILGSYYGLHSMAWFRNRTRLSRALILTATLVSLMLVVGSILPAHD